MESEGMRTSGTEKRAYEVTTPVVLFIYARPDLTREVVQNLSNVSMKRLYVIADGPKEEKSNDKELCDSARSVVRDFEWDCDVIFIEREVNLGLKRNFVTGLSEVFRNENRLIVLEDDCVPMPEFFQFCDEMLERYDKNPEVFHVSGSNHHPGGGESRLSYSLSRYCHIWGWASWRESWEGFEDFAFQALPASLEMALEKVSEKPRGFRKHWLKRAVDELSGQNDGWDALWNLHCWRNGGKSITPRVPLVKNIGFGPHASHSRRVPLLAGHPPVPEKLDFPLSHPSNLESENEMDLYLSRVEYGIMPFVVKALLGSLELARRILSAFWEKGHPMISKRAKARSLSRRLSPPLTVAQFVFWGWRF